MDLALYRSASAGITLAVLMLFAPENAQAQNVSFEVELTGANEVPPVTTEATGTARVNFGQTSRRLIYRINYEGLSGPATGAHFHGPAEPGENADVVVPIEGDLTSPIAGSVDLTEEQAEQFLEGLWYINIHTEANPQGEIRGQVAEDS